MAFRSVGFQEAAEQLKAWGNAVLPSPRPTTPQTSPKNAVRESTFAKSPCEPARRLASQHCPDGPVRDHNTHYQENQLRYRHRTISPAWGNTTTLPTNRASKSRSRPLDGWPRNLRRHHACVTSGIRPVRCFYKIPPEDCRPTATRRSSGAEPTLGDIGGGAAGKPSPR